MYCIHHATNAGISSESLVWQPSRNPEGLDEGTRSPCGGCGLGEDRQEEHPDYPSRGEPEEMIAWTNRLRWNDRAAFGFMVSSTFWAATLGIPLCGYLAQLPLSFIFSFEEGAIEIALMTFFLGFI